MHFLLLFSRQGKLRLQKWFTPMAEREKKKVIRDMMMLVLPRPARSCNFLQWRDLKIVYKRWRPNGSSRFARSLPPPPFLCLAFLSSYGGVFRFLRAASFCSMEEVVELLLPLSLSTKWETRFVQILSVLQHDNRGGLGSSAHRG